MEDDGVSLTNPINGLDLWKLDTGGGRKVLVVDIFSLNNWEKKTLYA